MTVYVVEHEFYGDDHWVQGVFATRAAADEYCIRQGCSQRTSEGINTNWMNPKNNLERMYVTEWK